MLRTKKKLTKKKIVWKKTRAKKLLPKKKVIKNIRTEKPIGVITHYYRKIGVGIIKCKIPFKAGIEIRIQGATTNFSQMISSLQYNHKEVKNTKKCQLVGVKMKKRVREGDVVYRVS